MRYLSVTSRNLRWLLLACLTLCILATTGCALNPGPAPVRMQLHPALPEQMPADRVLGKLQLVVGLPSATNDLDTDAIVLVFNERQVKYLAGVRWVNRAPRIIQSTLIDALEHLGVLKGVAGEHMGITADAKLFVDLKQFGLEYGADPLPEGVFSATCKLVDLNDGEILATLQVRTVAKATGTDSDALVVACENALADALKTISPWVVEHMRRVK